MMCVFIKVTTKAGGVHYMNADNIRDILQTDPGSQIILSDNDMLRVQETPKEILHTMREMEQRLKERDECNTK